MTLQITRIRIRRPAAASTKHAGIAKVRVDRRLSMASLVLALILCWPLFVFGRPAYYEDTLSYYKGGNAALAFVAGKLEPSRPSTAGSATAGPEPPGALIAEARGARSISYSVLSALLAGPGTTFIFLSVLQALLLAFCAAVLLRASRAGAPSFGAAAVLLAVGTPAAWFASFASPDVFAGITILVVATLCVFGERLSGAVIVAMALIGAFAMTAHSSHLALAIAMLGLALICSRSLRTRVFGNRKALFFVVGPVALGLTIVVIGGFIGFGEVSLAPKRYPLTLARSIDNGAARLYLRETCPLRKYLVCELFGDAGPRSGGEFLWGTKGIAKHATPEQMARLRAEEWEIVLNATLRHPWLEFSHTTGSVLRQLVTFGLGGVSFDQRLALTEKIGLVPEPRTPLLIVTVLDALIYGVAIFSSAALAILYRRMSPEQRRFAAYVLAGLILNAAICAYFSAVANRYQARVIWLLPLVAIVARPPQNRQA